jgi:protoporphyrinogen oxidase
LNAKIIELNRQDYKIHIVGAGISGLVAAIELEKAGYRPAIIEGTDSVGGRVKTDHANGLQFDHGFQVLLESYPMAKKYLNYETLQLQKLLPAALVYRNGKGQLIGDPIRELSLFWDSLTSSLGSFSDKIKVFQLNRKLQSKSIDEIFNTDEQTTYDYLKAYGLSDKIIENFFRPFFTGIFLEPDLKTSSRMFEFVYKMFGSGLAAIPKNGIGAISQQLLSQLQHTKVLFNTKVKRVEDHKIIFDDGTSTNTHFTIIASSPSKLISNLNGQEIHWKSCYNLYFKTNKRSIKKPVIGLMADGKALINNIFFHTSLELKEPQTDELLSVTVVKEHQLDQKSLIKKVEQELNEFCGITGVSFLKMYHIPQALPDLNNLEYDTQPMNTRIKPTVFLAGDYLLNGSLNAAMIAGERAAQGIIAALEDGLVVENLTSEYINDR